jgi:ABC-2 type transport system permease protein
MELEAVYSLWLREMKRYSREVPRLLGNLATPFLWLAILGVGLGSAFAIPNESYTYLNYIAPGIVGLAVLFTSVFAGISVISDRQSGVMKEVLAAPVSRTSIVLGKAAGSSTASVVNGAIIFALALAIGALPLYDLNLTSIFFSLVIMALLSLGFVSLGLAIASKTGSHDGFQLFMSILILPLLFLSGAFFPLAQTPFLLRVFALVDPLMYGVDGLRAVMINDSLYPLWLDLGVLGLFSIASLLFASFLFNRMEK